MSCETPNTLRVEQVESYGRLLAGFSHEMKNHLGIIRESNGLADDLLLLHGAGLDEQLRTALHKSFATIEERVKTMALAFHHLSGFAHRSDTPLCSFQPEQLVQELCQFLDRFARLAQVTLSNATERPVSAVYNDAALLHHVLYRLFVVCLEALQPGDSIYILTASQHNKVNIELQCNTSCRLGEDACGSLITSFEQLQATCSIGHKDAMFSVKLSVPCLSGLDLF